MLKEIENELLSFGFNETSIRLYFKNYKSYKYEAKINGLIYCLKVYEYKNKIIVLISDLGSNFSPFKFAFEKSSDAIRMIADKISKWESD